MNVKVRLRFLLCFTLPTCLRPCLRPCSPHLGRYQYHTVPVRSAVRRVMTRRHTVPDDVLTRTPRLIVLARCATARAFSYAYCFGWAAKFGTRPHWQGWAAKDCSALRSQPQPATCPSPVLGFWGKMSTPNAGIMAYRRDFPSTTRI